MAAVARQLLAVPKPKEAAPPPARAAKLARSPRLARDPRFMRTVDRLQRTTARTLRPGTSEEVAFGQSQHDVLGSPTLQRAHDPRFSSVFDARLQAMRVSSPHDPAEHEAHATARAIVGMPAPDEAATAVADRAPAIARKAEGPAAAPHDVMGEIGRARGTGRPLPSSVRRFMEPRFGADFGAVRMHTGDQAAKLNRQLNAQAFTLGDQVFFGRDRFRPESHEGRELIAHELTHTIQQGAATQTRDDEAAHRSPDPTVSSSTSPHVQRLGVQDVLDYFADKANLIPGYRMFTIVVGVNPVNMSSVDRSAANILRAVVEFLPGGNLITRALDAYGVFDKAGAWIEGQLAALGISGASIKAAIDQFIHSLSWTDVFDLGGVWTRAKAILGDPVSRILTFVRTLFSAILDMIKDAVLRPLAELASQSAGWDLLCAVLGKNPITGDPVPRTAETLIGGFMKLIGQEEIWENIKKGKAIPRAFAWFQGALEGALGFVREIPALFINTLKSLTIEDIVILPQAFIKVGKAFAGFATRFFDWAGSTIWDLLEIIFSVVAPGVLVYLKKARAAFKKILENPIGFIGNLVKAATQGLNQFVAKFPAHLKASLIGWLTGALGGAGIYIPQAFTLVEIGKCVLSVLGITWVQIRGKIVKALGPAGETIMKGLETGFAIVKALVTGGPAAAWEVIKQQLTDLRDTVLQAIIGYVKDRIIQKAITMLLSMLNPAGAFIQAVIAIYNGVMAFVERLKQIAQVVAAFIDSISAIADGAIGAAANRVEQTLGGLLTLVISFLARIMGAGNVGAKVVELIKVLQAKVDAALEKGITWIIEKAKALFKSLFGKKDKKDERTEEEKKRDLDKGLVEADALVADSKLSPADVRTRLPAIKAKYKMTSLELATDASTDEEETDHVQGEVNPKGKRPPRKKPKGKTYLGATSTGPGKFKGSFSDPAWNWGGYPSIAVTPHPANVKNKHPNGTTVPQPAGTYKVSGKGTGGAVYTDSWRQYLDREKDKLKPTIANTNPTWKPIQVENDAKRQLEMKYGSMNWVDLYLLKDWEAHHIKPVNWGGTNARNNFQNLRKAQHTSFTKWWEARKDEILAKIGP